MLPFLDNKLTGFLGGARVKQEQDELNWAANH